MHIGMKSASDLFAHLLLRLDLLRFLNLASFSLIRALTSFFTSVTGNGLPIGKRIVPLEVS